MSDEGLRSHQFRAWASVLAAIVASTTMRVVAMATSLPRITAGMPAGIEGVVRVMVAVKTLMHRDCGTRLTTLSCLVD